MNRFLTILKSFFSSSVTYVVFLGLLGLFCIVFGSFLLFGKGVAFIICGLIFISYAYLISRGSGL